MILLKIVMEHTNKYINISKYLYIVEEQFVIIGWLIMILNVIFTFDMHFIINS
jgi:hypothetical protein